MQPVRSNKGGNYALDNLCDTRSALAVGVDQWIHDRRIHPSFADHRDRCGIDKNHSGSKDFVVDAG